MLFGPQTTDQLHPFSETGGSFFTAHTQCSKFFERVTLSRAEIKTAIRQEIDAGSILGHSHGMLERHEKYIRANADAIRACGDGCRCRQRRWIIAVVSKMVLR